jgi:hypothetical protein
MSKTDVLFTVVASLIVLAPLAATARESTPTQSEEEDTTSLASPDYQGYRPAWANPYADPPEIGINDDPTPFYPSDVDSGGSLFDNDNF